MNNKIKANFNKILTLTFLLIFLNQCGMGADARKYPPEPSKRVQKNLEEGRGFRLSGGDKGVLFIEVQRGICLPDDIVRLEDDYGRVL